MACGRRSMRATLRYLREDLDAWVWTRRRKSTSDDGTALAAKQPVDRHGRVTPYRG